MIAVVTAGGRVDAAFQAAIGTDVKALAPWRSGCLIDPAIDAARANGATRIIVVGDEQVRRHCVNRVDTVLDASIDGGANLALALGQAQPDLPLLLLTSDMPFIDAPALQFFLEHVGTAQAAMPLADGGAYTRRYPQASKHVTTLAGEQVANGNVFYFSSAAAAQQALEIAGKLFHARKSLVKMARFLELPLLMRYFFRTLGVHHIELYAERRYGLRAKAIRQCAPELCFDIDALVDYRYAQAYRE